MSLFISYSRADSDVADLLYRLLGSMGYAVWMDRQNLTAGSQWDHAIQAAIESASTLAVLLSPDAIASPNVTDEWNYALDQGKRIIPLKIRECAIPMRLHRVQWIDFTDKPFNEAFKIFTGVLGTPENRPTDPIELARREGLIFVDSRAAFGLFGLRIGFDYRDYPQAQPLLNAIWQALLSRVIEQHQYGKTWLLEDRNTGRRYVPSDGWTGDSLLHEVGIEPGAQLKVVLIEEGALHNGS